ncbi:MAG: hypothetical protein HY007_01595 [Candidatus Sungbacteria bacterium]|nr:hypothetical protein [Candidatus Sungbacteria bacterium]
MIDRDKIYYVESAKDPTVLLALDARLGDDKNLRWFDTRKERIMKVNRVAEDTAERFAFEREGGGTYVFTPLTLKRYEESVKSRLVQPESFEREEDLFTALKKTREYAL